LIFCNFATQHPRMFPGDAPLQSQPDHLITVPFPCFGTLAGTGARLERARKRGKRWFGKLAAVTDGLLARERRRRFASWHRRTGCATPLHARLGTEHVGIYQDGPDAIGTSVDATLPTDVP